MITFLSLNNSCLDLGHFLPTKTVLHIKGLPLFVGTKSY